METGASGRKTSESEVSGVGSARGEDIGLRRSTDCIVSKDFAASSEMDLR